MVFFSFCPHNIDDYYVLVVGCQGSNFVFLVVISIDYTIKLSRANMASKASISPSHKTELQR
jgi:hypothetical protein